MESMTGYAHMEGKTPQFSFTVEVKSLNSKFQEIYINVPKVLSHEEYEINDFVKKEFTRGKVELSIDVYDWTEPRAVSVNEPALEKYYKGLVAFRKKIKAQEDFSLDSLLLLDGVVQKGKSGISDQSVAIIKKSVGTTLKKVTLMRREEGKALEKDLLSSASSIEKNLAKVGKLTEFSSKERFDKLKERIDRISPGIEDSRLYSEVALYADRIDINEEITRLTDHLKKFHDTAKEKDQVGKKLDFIAQEMFREANTIGSKTASSEVSHLCVEIKNNIEKIREQCRNVV
jgi:uncharacterized protein (TIGR00255 family)